MSKPDVRYRLPVRDDVAELTYHREPTPSLPIDVYTPAT
jgi:hypothetical protein